MKTKNLQKLSNTDTKLKKLLALKQINKTDIQPLSEAEKRRFDNVLSSHLSKLTGVKRDEFLNKIEDITSDDTKNQLWESNHIVILNTISIFMQDYARMPSVVEIATKTGLSRQTVNKHLDSFKSHPLHKQQIERFRLMSSAVLAKVYQHAMSGNIKAARLYFSVMGMLDNDETNKTQIENQNNYIQINGMVLSQEAVKQLQPEQLKTIESILKTVNSI
jgi:DNA-binding phage protein